MKNVYSGQEIIKHVFKDELSYVTLVKWCRKGILNPYHRTTSVGNVHDKSLFTVADTVLAGVINNIFACGVSHERLLGMPVMLIGMDGKPFRIHKTEIGPDGDPELMDIPWRDMGRHIQQYLGENRFKVMFRLQLRVDGAHMLAFCMEDRDTVEREQKLVFSSWGGYTGAVVHINAKLIHNSVKNALDPNCIRFPG